MVVRVSTNVRDENGAILFGGKNGVLLFHGVGYETGILRNHIWILGVVGR